jgi:hypothetical protein
MSLIGMPSVMQTISATSASAASMIASAAKGGGTKMTEAVAPVCLDGVADGVEDGDAEDLLAALAGGDAADDLGAVLERVLGVERPTLPVMPWTMQTGVLVDEDAHDFTCPECTILVGGVVQAGGRDDVQAALVEHLLAELDVGALEADDQGDLEADLLDRRDDAGGDRVALHDAAEDVDQDALHVGVAW